MEMQQVRYFVALAQELNFTRAADRCNVSQPALTRAIQQLEHELGGPLFHRERGKRRRLARARAASREILSRALRSAYVNNATHIGASPGANREGISG